MSLQLRPIAAHEFDAFHHALGVPFGFDTTPEQNDRARQVAELARLRAVFDGPQIVATFGAFSLTLTVPGGTIPTAGTTMVSVLPTHRRRGLLRRFMAEHLNELHEGGEPLAHRFAALARAGLVSGTPEARRRADAMFAWEPLPWCPEQF
jgi:predicted acetyltransferase